MRPRVAVLLNLLSWKLWAGRGPSGERPLFWFVWIGPVEIRLMGRKP